EPGAALRAMAVPRRSLQTASSDDQEPEQNAVKTPGCSEADTFHNLIVPERWYCREAPLRARIPSQRSTRIGAAPIGCLLPGRQQPLMRLGYAIASDGAAGPRPQRVCALRSRPRCARPHRGGVCRNSPTSYLVNERPPQNRGTTRTIGISTVGLWHPP